MKFKGDIIITDPCYVIKKKTGRPSIEDYPILAGKASKQFSEYNDEEDEAYDQLCKDREQWDLNNTDDWETCDYGENMEALGINNYLTSSTIYGDWSCNTFDTDTKESIGEFCADAGLVSVFLLDEILAYNPEFDYHLNRPWTCTLIKDFDGDVSIEEAEYEWENEDTGEMEKDDEVRVIGKGNINFFTSQTGL